MKQNGHSSTSADFASTTPSPLNNNLSVKFVPILAKSPQRELRPFTSEIEHLNIMTKQQSRQHSTGNCQEMNSSFGNLNLHNRPVSPSIPEHSVAQYINGCTNSYGHLSALENDGGAVAVSHKSTQETNPKTNSTVSNAPTHWYQGFLNRTSRAIPSKVMFRSTSHSELKKSDAANGGVCSPLTTDYNGVSSENLRGGGGGGVVVVVQRGSVNVAASSSSSTSYSFENGSATKADGNGSTATSTTTTTTTNVLLPRREYGSTSSIDQLLAQQTDQRRLQRNPKQQQQQCSSAFSNHNRGGVVVETASSTSGSQSSRSSSDSKKVFVGGGQLEHNRASLRREKAIDLPSYASAEHQHQHQHQHHHQQQNSLPTSIGSGSSSFITLGTNKESKFNKKDTKAKTSRSKSSNESILKKLIGGGGGSKSASTDDSPTMAGTAAALNSRDSIKPDFSSDSLDFKSEEKLRKRIFAHYDCGSICATPIPLLNGRSRLEEGNLNAATGASQASRPKPTSPSSAVDTPWLINDETSCADEGDTKSNDIVLSCPYFRNELGGEPLRTVSLSRSVSERQQSNRQLDDGLETWLRPSTAAESSVLENLSNVYLGGRLCASRQDNLIIEYVDQGAFYYRHCFSGKGEQNFFFLLF